MAKFLLCVVQIGAEAIQSVAASMRLFCTPQRITQLVLDESDSMLRMSSSCMTLVRRSLRDQVSHVQHRVALSSVEEPVDSNQPAIHFPANTEEPHLLINISGSEMFKSWSDDMKKPSLVCYLFSS